eukprot:TRINITY_DN22903_c0_g2_i2.p2 TRINITY_DN22903_c0_g2~~TRINITY_DN22903_c0_g2_i2.p2  ORF type:complete len:132 (+),score=28.63 TRINITY_DN22903_c0_g2_i2:395-790(+)
MTSAMDDLLGHCAFLGAGKGPWSGATVQVNCKLMKPVRVGQTLLLEGRVVRQEKKDKEKAKVFVEGCMKDEQGAVYASMDGISIVGVKLHEEESHLDRREWVFDEAAQAVFDSSDWHSECTGSPKVVVDQN